MYEVLNACELRETLSYEALAVNATRVLKATPLKRSRDNKKTHKTFQSFFKILLFQKVCLETHLKRATERSLIDRNCCSKRNNKTVFANQDISGNLWLARRNVEEGRKRGEIWNSINSVCSHKTRIVIRLWKLNFSQLAYRVFNVYSWIINWIRNSIK